MNEQVRKPRGFATLSPERRKEISSRGGKGAHAAGTAHRFTTEEAKAAGAKGGRSKKARADAIEIAAPDRDGGEE